MYISGFFYIKFACLRLSNLHFRLLLDAAHQIQAAEQVMEDGFELALFLVTLGKSTKFAGILQKSYDFTKWLLSGY